MTRPDLLRGPVPAVLAALAFLLCSPAAASAAPAAVTVEIGVVVASTTGTTIDPSLSSIRSKLQAMFNYPSYDLVDRVKRSLGTGETGEFPLPGNRTIRVTPVEAQGNKVRLGVQIVEGGKNLLTTTLGLNRGGMVLVGGPPYQSGVLILLISAE